MKSKKTVKIFATLIISFLSGCVYDKFDNKLVIINKSTETVFVDISKKSSFNSHPISIDSVKRDTLWNYMRWIPAGDSLRCQPPFGSWEGYVNKSCEDSTLTVYLFGKKLLTGTPQDSLVKNQLYSKKYSYKVKDLEKLHWRIEYKE
ncbi:MAG: hypothetical protein JST69_02960 [Bacteroidetes bacterium]|nr:hypothetical protein [Bacteroidota bacterium]